jgi:hypothetical protein
LAETYATILRRMNPSDELDLRGNLAPWNFRLLFSPEHRKASRKAGRATSYIKREEHGDKARDHAREGHRGGTASARMSLGLCIIWLES